MSKNRNKQRKPRSPTRQPANVETKQVETVSEAEKAPISAESEAAKEPEQREPRKELAESDKRDPRESQTRDEQQSLAERRKKRIRIGKQQKLDVIALPFKKAGYYYRFVLDRPGRVEVMKLAEYEFVLDGNGKHVTFPSGSNHLHLMFLPQIFRDDDLKERREEINNRLARELEVGAEEYVPDDAKGVLTAGESFDPDE